MTSLFRAPSCLNKLPEICLEFLFNLIGKSTMAFLTDQLRHILKSWYTGGTQSKDFGAVLQTGSTRSLGMSVAQAW